MGGDCELRMMHGMIRMGSIVRISTSASGRQRRVLIDTRPASDSNTHILCCCATDSRGTRWSLCLLHRGADDGTEMCILSTCMRFLSTLYTAGTKIGTGPALLPCCFKVLKVV